MGFGGLVARVALRRLPFGLTYNYPRELVCLTLLLGLVLDFISFKVLFSPTIILRRPTHVMSILADFWVFFLCHVGYMSSRTTLKHTHFLSHPSGTCTDGLRAALIVADGTGQ